MVVAVVFAFAVADGLSPVVAAAPYDVLSRQLPRLLVARLNSGGDRGVRFFPFLGPVGGHRNFLCPREPFEPGQLAQLHKQGEAQLLCDGVLRDGTLHWRVIDGRSARVLHESDVPFDARKPIDVLARLEFETTGLLGWSGRPQPAQALTGEALGWFLVLKDALLRREANVPESGADPLRPARKCVELASRDEDVVQVVMDYTAQVLRAGEHRAEVAALLGALAAVPSLREQHLERLAALLHAAGDEPAAATTASRAALAHPERAELVERAAAQLFRLERYAEARAVVEAARRRGTASLSALAQLAAVCDRTDDGAMRRQLTDELLRAPDLPTPIARLVVSFLIEEGRTDAARGVAQRALARDPSHAALRFDLGRACLLLGDDAAAAQALREALERGLPPALAPQAQRFLRLASTPGLWAATQLVENKIAGGDLLGALQAVHALVRRVGPVAEAFMLLGIVRHKLGHSRRAEHALRRALRLDGDLAEAHNRLGILLVSRGRVEDGHRHLVQAHALAPTESSPLLHLAQACALLGRLDEAGQHIDAAERLGAQPQLVAAVRREVFAKPA
jgi:Flp pilus assembly protein TadD